MRTHVPLKRAGLVRQREHAAHTCCWCAGRAPRLHGFTPRARVADVVYELVLGAPLALVLRFVLAIGYTPRLHRINDSVGVRKDL